VATLLGNDCAAIARPQRPPGAWVAMVERQIRLYLCGRLAVEAGQAVVREADLPARQGRRLWAYLVLHRRHPVGHDRLADALWGEDAPDTWEGTLAALISRLRRALAPVSSAGDGLAVRGEPGRYTLHLPTDTFVDLERARLAVHDADRLLRQGMPGPALAEARVAMEIAGRGFLPGEEAPWIIGQRRELAEIRSRAHERTVEAELTRGRVDLAEIEARALLGHDPLRESGYRLLMRALAAGGNAAQARHVFDDCRRVLREQAQARPSPETERLIEELTTSR